MISNITQPVYRESARKTNPSQKTELLIFPVTGVTRSATMPHSAFTPPLSHPLPLSQALGLCSAFSTLPSPRKPSNIIILCVC